MRNRDGPARRSCAGNWSRRRWRQYASAFAWTVDYNHAFSLQANIMPPSTSRYDLLHKRLERFTRSLHGVDKGEIRAIHRTRVASRRLREVLPVLELDADVSAKLVRRLRRVTAQLGPVREL